MTGAQLLVKTLNLLGVKYIFGIPGAKIDMAFDALLDGGPEIVVCRHEQNAAFMAGAWGKITGEPGVCLVTSGPGCSNLATGLATATSEGEPLIALGGSVSRSMRLKRTHQSMDTVAMLRPVTKSAVEVEVAESIPEAVINAYRTSKYGLPGAAFVSLPQDVLAQTVEIPEFSRPPLVSFGASPARALGEAAGLISKAKLPVMLLGMQASRPDATQAVRGFLRTHRIPVVCTYDGAGVISRDLLDCFVGRVGLFRNQPGDRLLAAADVIVSVGFNPIEYDPQTWNVRAGVRIIHIDTTVADWDLAYQPSVALPGDIKTTVEELASMVSAIPEIPQKKLVGELQEERLRLIATGGRRDGVPIHPLRLVTELRALLDDRVTVICDVGSLYIWMARYFLTHEPRRLLFSNGQQTLGVALPRAIGVALARPGEKVVSMSGDGGFLFSAMELETAVRLKLDIVHLVWVDGSYDMVKIQQLIKYGRESAVSFGPVDIVKYAEAFGAQGFRVRRPDEIAPVLSRAMGTKGPAIIEVQVDYSENRKLAEVTRSAEIL